MIASSTRPIFVIADRLVEIWSRNNRDLAEMQARNQRVERARAYLSSPGANRVLGMAYLQRAQEAQQAQLALLRSNRLEAWKVLGLVSAQLSPEPGAPAFGQYQAEAVCVPSSSSTPRHCWYA